VCGTDRLGDTGAPTRLAEGALRHGRVLVMGAALAAARIQQDRRCRKYRLP